MTMPASFAPWTVRELARDRDGIATVSVHLHGARAAPVNRQSVGALTIGASMAISIKSGPPRIDARERSESPSIEAR
jgi:hypothetical protein